MTDWAEITTVAELEAVVGTPGERAAGKERLALTEIDRAWLAASRNLIANPHVGLNFLIPGRADTLRINGWARLVSDAPFFDELAVRDRRPILALVVEIETIFFHCGKAFMRSQLWQPETWAPEAIVPRRAVIAQELEPQPDKTLAELDDYYRPENYAKGLY